MALEISNLGRRISGDTGFVMPYYNEGLEYYVDGAGGDDANNGRTWDYAFKTIQHAIDVQDAAPSGKGDTIWIAPGNYVESLIPGTTSGTLTRVALIGVPGNYPWHIVSVRPTDGSAFHGSLFETLIKNICFLSADTDNKDYPAVHLDNARYAIIEDCHFVGRDLTCVEGLQIGYRGVDDPQECHLDYCIIRRNRFDTWYGHNSQFTFGIKIGAVNYDDGSGVMQMVGTTIEHNIIFAEDYGMYFCVGGSNADFAVVRFNVVDSPHQPNGVQVTGIEFYGGYPMVYKNWVNALTDALAVTASGAMGGRALDNWIGEAGAAKIEGPAMV